MISKASSIVVFEHGMRRQEHFNDDVVDVRPEFVHVVAVFTQPFVYGRDSSKKINK